MYETSFQNAIKVLPILPTIYKNKLKMPGKNRKDQVYTSYLSIIFDGTI